MDNTCFDVNFNIDVPTILCVIMRNNRSDKGHTSSNAWHNYTLLYTELFKKFKPKRIFELGLGSNNINIPSNMGSEGRPGASLYGWSEYFPDAKVYGADIDYECLFSTEKIKTFYCDQTNPSSIKNLWNQYELLDGFDFMIDDGLHTIESIICFFENSHHKLNPGGYYSVEDIRTIDLSTWEQQIGQWIVKYPNFKFNLSKITNHVNPSDNNMILIYRVV